MRNRSIDILESHKAKAVSEKQPGYQFKLRAYKKAIDALKANTSQASNENVFRRILKR